MHVTCNEPRILFVSLLLHFLFEIFLYVPLQKSETVRRAFFCFHNVRYIRENSFEQELNLADHCLAHFRGHVFAKCMKN